jgi:acyl carrier protein
MQKELLDKLAVICEQKELTSDFLLSEIDSLSRAELIVTVEEAIGVMLSNEEIIAMKTFGDLESMIESKTGGNGD